MSHACASKPKPTRLPIINSNNNSATLQLLHVHDHPMTPSSATPRRTSRARRRRCRNAAAGRTPLGGATARVLAAGLWRLRHAERLQAAGPPARPHRHESSTSARLRTASPHQQGRRGASPLCHGNKRRTDQSGAGSQYQCRNRHGILDKIEACVEFPPMAYGSSMEKATKWDPAVCYANHLDDILGSHDPTAIWKARSTTTTTTRAMVVALEAELEKARAQIGELEDERRVKRKRLERFLRKQAEEKSRMREKAQRAVSEARLERRHRRQLEAANGKLMRELGEARASAKQQAQSYEMERKARELMEEACSELTREVEEDQVEVELLRRECLRMREDMEEERRMLQMAEVWREERVQMKLSDSKLALETKYSQLNRLQAEMEAFLRNKDDSEARIISAAAPAAASSSARSRRDHHADEEEEFIRHHQNSQHSHVPGEEDLDSVFEHFRRREKEKEEEMSANGARYSSAASPASSNVQSASPATDLFLAKVDDDGGGGDPYSDVSADGDGGRDSCSWVGTSDRSASVARASNASIPNYGGSGVTEAPSSGASRRSVGKNTALIRRLWRSAITESRKKTGAAPRSGGDQASGGGGGWSPSPGRRSTLTASAAPPAVPVAAEQCSSSGSVNLWIRKRDAKAGHDGGPLPQRGGTQQHNKQSLKEKLMEARMDDQKEKPSSALP